MNELYNSVNNLDGLEELDISEEDLDLEEIMRGTSAYPFPVVIITGNHITFSVKAAECIGRVKAVTYKISKDYILMKFWDKPMYNSFLIWGNKRDLENGKYYPVGIFPVSLRRKRVRTGAYKLYKYKDGFAIKINEPLDSLKAQ